MTALTLIMPACTLITVVLVWMAVREAISTLREPDVTPRRMAARNGYPSWLTGSTSPSPHSSDSSPPCTSHGGC